MTTLKLTREQAQELVWDEADPGCGFTVESDEQTGTSRWESIHRLVIKDEAGKFWAATYRKGLTEYQDSRPFEDLPEVEFREVEKVPVTTYEYRPVKRAEVTA